MEICNIEIYDMSEKGRLSTANQKDESPLSGPIKGPVWYLAT